MGEWLLSRRDRLIVARHEVPGYDRSVPPGRACRRFATASRERVSKTLQGKNIPNRPYLRAIQPWAKFFSPFGALKQTVRPEGA